MTVYKRNTLDSILAEAGRRGLSQESVQRLNSVWAESYVLYRDENPRVVSKENIGEYIERAREYANKQARLYMASVSERGGAE